MKVIGLGDNVVDEYVHKNIYYPGGNALNFSVYAKMLGYDSSYMGVFGTDDAAEHVIGIATKLGIDLERCRVVEGENGHAYIGLKNGDRIFLRSNRGGVLKENPIILNDEDLDYLKQFSLIHTSINSYIFDELPKLNCLGIPISFDFSIIKDEDVLNIVCPYIDIAVTSCGEKNDAEVEEVISVFHKKGARLVLATMGERGSVFSKGVKRFYSSVDSIEAKDTIGAGDSFLTSFLLGYIGSGEDELIIPQALINAGKFAAKICMIDGAFGYGKELDNKE